MNLFDEPEPFSPKEYLKSPFNYTGQKYPILGQILPLFPKKETVSSFWDVFAGGGSVFMNADYENVHINDIITPLAKFYSTLRVESWQTIEENIKKYAISKDSPEQYAALRTSFNLTGNEYEFFCLVSSCTNNMGRFNLSGKFNQTFGKRSVNANTWLKLKAYHEQIKKIQTLNVHNREFSTLFAEIGESDFIYLDPPYMKSAAPYNIFWSEQKETDLYKFAESLNSKGIRFAMSNVSQHKGKKYNFEQYFKSYKTLNVHNIAHNYDKVSRAELIGDTQEILITNF